MFVHFIFRSKTLILLKCFTNQTDLTCSEKFVTSPVFKKGKFLLFLFKFEHVNCPNSSTHMFKDQILTSNLSKLKTTMRDKKNKPLSITLYIETKKCTHDLFEFQGNLLKSFAVSKPQPIKDKNWYVSKFSSIKYQTEQANWLDQRKQLFCWRRWSGRQAMAILRLISKAIADCVSLSHSFSLHVVSLLWCSGAGPGCGRCDIQLFVHSCCFTLHIDFIVARRGAARSHSAQLRLALLSALCT